VGGDGADVISGYYGDDVLFSAGTDQAALYDWREYVDTGTEHDILDGGPGGNTFYAGYGDDVLGGSDNDWLSLSLIGAPSGITLNVADLDSTYEPVHFAGGQISRIHGIFELFGSNFSDTLTLTGGMRVYGMGGDDVINGDAQDDEILGGDGNDTLRGDAGIDTLAGNSGDDTFRDTAAGLNGDTITDLTSADKIIITDATLAGFTADLSGHTLTFSGGTLTIANVASARVVASAAVGGGVQLMIVHPPTMTSTATGRATFCGVAMMGRCATGLVSPAAPSSATKRISTSIQAASGMLPAPATSTATGVSTSCGAAMTGRCATGSARPTAT
jgi:Ca2+-binding RTX toxin-like protein